MFQRRQPGASSKQRQLADANHVEGIRGTSDSNKQKSVHDEPNFMLAYMGNGGHSSASILNHAILVHLGRVVYVLPKLCNTKT